MLKVIITALVVALVVWSIVRILDQRRAAGTSAALRQERNRGVTAPDDDPEFLWRLERERRRGRQTDTAGETGAAEPAKTSSDGPVEQSADPDAERRDAEPRDAEPRGDETGDSTS